MKQSRENLDLPLQGTNVNEGDTTATLITSAREDDLVGFALSISSSKNKNNRCFRLMQRSPVKGARGVVPVVEAKNFHGNSREGWIFNIPPCMMRKVIIVIAQKTALLPKRA